MLPCYLHNEVGLIGPIESHFSPQVVTPLVNDIPTSFPLLLRADAPRPPDGGEESEGVPGLPRPSLPAPGLVSSPAGTLCPHTAVSRPLYSQHEATREQDEKVDRCDWEDTKHQWQGHNYRLYACRLPPKQEESWRNVACCLYSIYSTLYLND